MSSIECRAPSNSQRFECQTAQSRSASNAELVPILRLGAAANKGECMPERLQRLNFNWLALSFGHCS
jgi:hypothetical protein